MRSALIDYLCPSGHLPIIQFYINNLKKEFQYVYINSNVKKDLENIRKINFINFKSNFIFKIYQLIKLFKLIKKNKIKKIIFLSYNPYDLLFLGFFLNLNYFKIFIFDHDTLNQNKVFKFFTINYLNKNITHIVYTPQKKKLLKFKFRRKVFISNHPIIRSKHYKKNENNKKVILIPTRHHFRKDLIDNFINKNPGFYFYILSKKSNLQKNLFNRLKNIKLIEYIKDKDINKITCIYLPLNDSIYKYRISAWLYKAIAFNKKVILENNDLYRFEKKRFPTYILLNKQNNFLRHDFKIKKDFKINNYNNLLLENLKRNILIK